ncbi:hypothetical protein ADP71_17580 [Vitreoscilla sp. C1]|nr:hypothetical protein [Vitreoscilla sp. C1]AUZ05285.1 hypothetical protein ADP71_17580 [Vitreoscilla sp. C1]
MQNTYDQINSLLDELESLSLQVEKKCDEIVTIIINQNLKAAA